MERLAKENVQLKSLGTEVLLLLLANIPRAHQYSEPVKTDPQKAGNIASPAAAAAKQNNVECNGGEKRGHWTGKQWNKIAVAVDE